MTVHRFAVACRIAGALLSLGACWTPPIGAPVETPAVIVEPTAESRAALAKAVSTAMNGAPVALADDALTRSSTLVIERVRPRDASGRPLDGRDVGVPERFTLLKRGERCVLLNEGTGRELVLERTVCAADPEVRR
jgi:hypothetical protein